MQGLIRAGDLCNRLNGFVQFMNQVGICRSIDHFLADTTGDQQAGIF